MQEKGLPERSEKAEGGGETLWPITAQGFHQRQKAPPPRRGSSGISAVNRELKKEKGWEQSSSSP